MDTYTPASKLLISVKKAARDKKYNEWFNCLPSNHIQSFISQGLRPFLLHFGYTLGFSDEKMLSYIKRWAFNYVLKNDMEFVNWAHNGGDEEYDWYRFNISIDDWDGLCKAWKASEFLDDSHAGFHQCVDLMWFSWACISLDLSKQHQRWIEINTDYEDEEQWVNEDNHAYGGDRRTY
jgi:hypothetical protein